jgi:hypothetical protein
MRNDKIVAYMFLILTIVAIYCQARGKNGCGHKGEPCKTVYDCCNGGLDNVCTTCGGFLNIFGPKVCGYLNFGRGCGRDNRRYHCGGGGYHCGRK